MGVPLLAVALGVLAIAGLIVLSYLAWLWLAPPSSVVAVPARSLPPVLIVVPVFDEAALIGTKLANLAELEYPPSALSIAIVDGGSTDGTLERIERWTAGRSQCSLLRTTLRNKTAQVNVALRSVTAQDWVLITDADGRLSPDTVLRLIAVVLADESVGVVGAPIAPTAAHALESLHWRTAGWLQRQEGDRGSSGLVAAPCYLTHRQFITPLPSDTIADDIHVACRAMAAGWRVCQGGSTVAELRSPQSLRQLLRHKYRKADGYLREIFRFLPHALAMPRPMRTIFICRAALLTIVPLLCLVSAVLVGGALVMHGAWASFTYPLWSAAGVVAVTLMPRGREAMRLITLGVLLLIIACAALVFYPLSRQTASFAKIAPSVD